MQKTGLVAVREAIEVLLRRLERLPTSERSEQLRTSVQDCMRGADPWSPSSQADHERGLLMRRVLALHLEVARHERDVAQEGETSVAAIYADG